MITAKEANKRTYATRHTFTKKAEEWVESEWSFIEHKIEEAIAKGEFSTSYWWSNELLQEAGIDKQSAAAALASKAYDLGFVQQVYQNYGNNMVLLIEIRWEKV